MLKVLKRLITRSYRVRFLYWLCCLNPIDLAARYLPVGTRWRAAKRRVAFVRLDGIGDYVIWSHTFDALDKIYPRESYERILIGSELWEDLARNEVLFDKAIYLDPPRAITDPVYRFRVFRSIRREAVDVVVNPRLTREFILMDSVVRVSGAAESIGSAGKANRMSELQERISNSWYSRLSPGPERQEHELISNFRFLETLDARRSFDPHLRKAESGGADAVPELAENGHFVIFPGAQQGDKMWPIERFAEAAKAIAERSGLQAVICGGPGDRALAEEFGRSFGPGYLDLTGRISLTQMCRVIEGAELLISNDTGAGHIAVARGCPTVIVTPGNHVGRFFPYPAEAMAEHAPQISVTHEMPCFGCDWHCKFTEIPPGEPKPCISDIPVSDVLSAAERALGTLSRRHENQVVNY